MQMRLPVVIAALSLSGCGLDKGGLGPWDLGDGGRATAMDGGGWEPSDSSSGGSPADIVLPQLDAPPGTCVSTIPTGWGLVVYETSRQACPAGYTTSYDTLTNPQAAAGACTCTCNVTTQPTCNVGSLHTSWGMGSSCSTAALPLYVGGSGCTQLQPGGPAPQVVSLQPLGPSGGACAGAAIGDTTKVTSDQVRYCVVPASSAESVCGGNAPAGFSSCIAAPGDVACPSGTPFSNKTLLADGEILLCTSCSSCTVQGSCSTPTVAFYGTYLCGGYVGSLSANGACTSPSWAGTTVNSIKYSAEATATCSAAGTSATFQGMGTQTVCCR